MSEFSMFYNLFGCMHACILHVLSVCLTRGGNHVKFGNLSWKTREEIEKTTRHFSYWNRGTTCFCQKCQKVNLCFLANKSIYKLLWVPTNPWQGPWFGKSKLLFNKGIRKITGNPTFEIFNRQGCPQEDRSKWLSSLNKFQVIRRSVVIYQRRLKPTYATTTTEYCFICIWQNLVKQEFRLWKDFKPMFSLRDDKIKQNSHGTVLISMNNRARCATLELDVYSA